MFPSFSFCFLSSAAFTVTPARYEQKSPPPLSCGYKHERIQPTQPKWLFTSVALAKRGPESGASEGEFGCRQTLSHLFLVVFQTRLQNKAINRNLALAAVCICIRIVTSLGQNRHQSKEPQQDFLERFPNTLLSVFTKLMTMLLSVLALMACWTSAYLRFSVSRFLLEHNPKLFAENLPDLP